MARFYTPLALSLGVLWFSSGCGKTKTDASMPAVAESVDAAGGKRVAVEANAQGFTPSTVNVVKGERTTLVFKRTSDETCATEVVFPELKLEKKLPLNEAVAFEVPTDQSRTLSFQCGMGMYKSKVVVQLHRTPG
jgi:plastocyanin domain-containing protein